MVNSELVWEYSLIAPPVVIRPILLAGRPSVNQSALSGAGGDSASYGH